MSIQKNPKGNWYNLNGIYVHTSEEELKKMRKCLNNIALKIEDSLVFGVNNKLQNG